MVPKETEESHVFETKNLCVNAGFVGNENDQTTKATNREKEDTQVSKRDTTKDRSKSIEKYFPT